MLSSLFSDTKKDREPAPSFFAYKGCSAPRSNMILRGGLTLSRFIINNHSRIVNHSANVCRNFIKSCKKIYAAPWFRCSVQKQLFLRFQVAFRQQKRLHSACIHCVYRGIPFHLQIPPVRAAGVGQLHGGAVLAGDYGGKYRCIKTAGRKVGVRGLGGNVGAQGRQRGQRPAATPSRRQRKRRCLRPCCRRFRSAR